MHVNKINDIEFDTVSCFPKLYLFLPICLLVFNFIFFLLHEMLSVNLVFRCDLTLHQNLEKRTCFSISITH